MMLHSYIKVLGLVVSDKKIFQKKKSSRKSIFSLCDLDMQWTGTICTIIKEGHIRVIPAKFGSNPASSYIYKEMSFKAIVNDAHSMITIAHH